MQRLFSLPLCGLFLIPGTLKEKELRLFQKGVNSMKRKRKTHSLKAVLATLLCLCLTGCSAVPACLVAGASVWTELENAADELEAWLQNTQLPDEEGREKTRQLKEAVLAMQESLPAESRWIQDGKLILNKEDLKDGEAMEGYGTEMVYRGGFTRAQSDPGPCFCWKAESDEVEYIYSGSRIPAQGGLIWSSMKRAGYAQGAATLCWGQSGEDNVRDGETMLVRVDEDGTSSGTMIYNNGFPIVSGRAEDGCWIMDGTGNWHVDEISEQQYW